MSVLFSALSLAGTALSPVADQAIKDGYAGFRDLLLRQFGSRSPELGGTLAKYEQKPEVWTEPAKDALREVGADRDQEVIDFATELLRRAEAAQPGIPGGLAGQINNHGGRVVVAQRVDHLTM